MSERQVDLTESLQAQLRERDAEIARLRAALSDIEDNECPPAAEKARRALAPVKP